VGDEACLACHESMQPGFSGKYGQTLHAHVLNAKNGQGALAVHSCEACHGPGEAHVTQGGGRGVGDFVPFGDASPEAVARINGGCLACPRGGDRTYWAGSAHQSADVACTQCHTLMENVSHAKLLAGPTEVETCARCHQAQYSRIYRNAHMPLRPGE